MNKNHIIISLIVLCLVGVIWGSVQEKKSIGLARELVAMEASLTSKTSLVGGDAAVQATLVTVREECEGVRSQNQVLLAEGGDLKERLLRMGQEIKGLRTNVVELNRGSQVDMALQAKLDDASDEIARLKGQVAADMVLLRQKDAALSVAKRAAAGLEHVKSSLANSVDTYSARSQALSVKVEEYALRISSLEKALDERTRRLVAERKELAKSALNMDVLLSKIASQNKSLETLEETRLVLEKELARKFQTIEDLQGQLSTKVVLRAVAPGPPVTKAPQK